MNMSTSTAIKTRVLALAGQPNTGKSTVFNRLTGARQHVGNWPGKTIEQKSGEFRYSGESYRVVDLPGTYSLTANSLEEEIARDFIIKERPDAVVVMADASQLERSLYLFSEIKLLRIPVVLALNMMDVAGDQGKTIQVDSLEKGLGIPVVPLVASRGEGIADLLFAVERAVSGELISSYGIPQFDEDTVFSRIKSILSSVSTDVETEEWAAMKIIEGDASVEPLIERLSQADACILDSILKTIPNGKLHAAGLRYKWISQVLTVSVSRNGKKSDQTRGERFDRVATHPFWGKAIAIVIMLLGFAAAMVIAMPLMGAVSPLTTMAAEAIRGSFTGSTLWFGSLLADGLIPGIAMSVMMLAYIFGVYLVFALLEDVGYVARLAFLFDRPMTRLGLHGKSFMPLLMSFGCNIAGVTGTRVIDSWQQRMVTLVMVSIVPCAALWGVVSFMGTIFFASAMPLIILSLLAVMFLHLSLTSFLLRRFVVPGKASGLIMELPPYHKPNWKTIFGYVWVQVKAFMKRAFTLIAVLSIVTWALSFRPDGNMELSVLASIGKFFDPVTRFLGLDWRLFVALLAAVIAKEASLSVIAVLFGLGTGALSITSFILGGSGVEHSVLAGSIAGLIGPASALAFIFAFFFSIPCIGTVGTIYSETKSLKWTLGSSLYYTVSSLVIGGLAYRVGLLIF